MGSLIFLYIFFFLHEQNRLVQEQAVQPAENDNLFLIHFLQLYLTLLQENVGSAKNVYDYKRQEIFKRSIPLQHVIYMFREKINLFVELRINILFITAT